MRLTDSDLATLCQRELQSAQGYDSDVLSSIRARALALYNGQMTQPVPGNSGVVSLDVADALHATLAQISPVVRTSQIEFEAMSQEDETAAQMETDFVRVMIERAGGYDIVDDACFDALLTGNGWLHPHVSERVRVTEQRFPGKLTDEQVFAIKSNLPPEAKFTVYEGADTTLAKFEVTEKKLVIECVAPEDMLFAECGTDFDLDEVRFVARRRLYTASQLRALGIPESKINELPDIGQDSTPATARLGELANTFEQSQQSANRLKEVFCCYIRVASSDATNKTELRHVWIGDNQNFTLLNEPAEYIPFITGSGVPMPHRITGTGFGELLGGIQSAKTHALRAWLDNMTALNGSKVAAVEGQVNMSDLTNGRINGVVRVRSPQAIVPLPSADIGQQCLANLSYLDHVRTQRVGAALDFTEVQAQLMGTSATAAAGQLSKVEMMGGWFAGNIVRTIMLPLFTMVHRIMRTELGGPTMARIAGKWQQTDTRQWQERTVTDIQMGLTTVEKAERMMALTQTLGQMQQMLATGGAGVITDLPRFFNAMSDWIRTANLGSPDQYLINPSSPEAQQAAKASADQQRKQQEEMVRMQAELIKLNQNFDLEKQRRELDYKRWSDELDAEVEEAKMVSHGAIEIKKLNTPKPETTDA